MISKALTTVLLTGFFAGILYTGAQMLRVTPLILESEKYEIVVPHSHGAAEIKHGGTLNEVGPIAAPHSHGSSEIKHGHVLNEIMSDVHQNVETSHKTLTGAHEHAGVTHSHASENWAPRYGAERTFYTAVSNVITAIAFSMILVAVFLFRGKKVDINTGIIWGAAGFAVFALVPALGLPPELPGMTAAVLESRQVWWLCTVLSTAISIGLFTESKTTLLKIVGLFLLAAPHLIGAPHPFLFESKVPAELSAQFAVASLATSAFFWFVIGGTSGYLYKKIVQETAGALLKTSTLKLH